MRKLSLLLIAALSLSSAQAAVRYFPHFGAGPAGSFRFETTLSLVNTGTDTPVTLDVFTSTGDPLHLEWEPWGTGSSFVFELAAGQTVSGRTGGGSGLEVGYVRLSAPESVQGNVVFSGTDTPSQVALFEAGVPLAEATRRLTLLVDSLGDRNTGLALVHSPETSQQAAVPAQLSFRLYDAGHQLLGTELRVLNPGANLALFVDEIFNGQPEVKAQAQELQGSLIVESTGSAVAAVTLRQLQTRHAFPQQVPVLTAFPVVVPDVQAPEWSLVWSDEFDGSQLDLTKWEPEIGRGPNNDGWGNNERQYYTGRPENVRVDGGTLKITATNQPYYVGNTPYTYTSARIRTRNRGDWKYGRFEFRARLPLGKGIWPAIWMLPTDNVYGGWAASGEIDIMELVGHEPHRVHGTLHYGGNWPNNVYTGMSYALRQGKFADDFHLFALEWEDGEMRWFVDGVLFLRQTWWHTSGHPFPAPFDQRFHLLINLAVGGNWPGGPDGTTQFPQTLEVDYVRVYQRPE